MLASHQSRVHPSCRAVGCALAFCLLSPHAWAGDLAVECDLPGIFPSDARWQVLSSGHNGCEGAQWVEDTLHYAAHHDGLALKWSESTGLVIWRKDSPEATSFRPDGAGGFYVVEQTTRQLTRWNADGQRVEILADRFEGRRLNRPNDVIVQSDGTLWFTDPDWLFNQRPSEQKELPGQFLFRFEPRAKTLVKAADGFDKPNGLVFSRDETQLFVSDTGTEFVFRFSVLPDGSLGPREVFAAFEEKGLDGLALSPLGHLWVCTRAGIRIVSMDGARLGLLKTPGKPSSIAFGPEGRLAVTTREACQITRMK